MGWTTRVQATIAAALIALAGCGSDDEDGDAPPAHGTDQRHIRATFELADGGQMDLDVYSSMLESGDLQDCEGKTFDGWGAAVAWQRAAPPAVGSYDLSGGLGTYPQMLISHPNSSGGIRFKFVGTGTVEFTEVGGGVVAGTFDGITFDVEDPDDRVAAVTGGGFRCEGNI